MTEPVVTVTGLKELQRALKAFDEGAKDLKAANKLAAEYVAKKAASKVPVLTGRMRASIRAAGQARGGLVRMGKGSLPYAGPLEFGGYPGSRPYIAAGRYLFPTAKASKPEITAIYNRELKILAKKYF